MEAFVYIWTNIKNNKKYIGYHKGTVDDGYICSSKNQEFWDDYAKGDLIRSIHFTGSSIDCINIESELLKFNELTTIYNRNINGKVIFTEDVRKKLSISGKGRKQSAEHIKNRSAALKNRRGGFKGKKHSEETLAKMRSVTRTDEHKQAISKASKGRIGTFTGKTHPLISCIHCKKIISISGLPQWHGDNCKENKWKKI